MLTRRVQMRRIDSASPNTITNTGEKKMGEKTIKIWKYGDPEFELGFEHPQEQMIQSVVRSLQGVFDDIAKIQDEEKRFVSGEYLIGELQSAVKETLDEEGSIIVKNWENLKEE